MVFATREEEIDYLRDELERAGYDEGSNQKWDEATLGRVRKLKLLEEEAPRRRRAPPPQAEAADQAAQSFASQGELLGPHPGSQRFVSMQSGQRDRELHTPEVAKAMLQQHFKQLYRSDYISDFDITV